MDWSESPFTVFFSTSNRGKNIIVCTFVALRVLGHLYSIVSWKDPSGTGPHVVALVPVILWLDLDQQRVIHLQLQLVIVARDKPAQTDAIILSISQTSKSYYELEDHLTVTHTPEDFRNNKWAHKHNLINVLSVCYDGLLRGLMIL